MNGRIVLTPGTVLKLSTKTGYTEYTIRRELARGCSCIVYDASYTDNLGIINWCVSRNAIRMR